ncbi:methyl-accepting chemotaxis protein [Ideonella sp. A 288]|uniref:methyl-accepting chemotaxis protein n=1 Tax=Ideonella sp. A 288 TaxID=1962181 RepID=UPI002872FB09|nr:methyl-accepting chemotaxis protein [Ideonella sp. A 288]
MMLALQRMGMARRLVLIVASALVGILLMAATALVTERGLLLEERRRAVRHTVETAHALVAHQHALAKTGAVDDAEAQKRARAALASLRYGGDEYFFVNDMQVRMVMHPIKPELDGKDLSQHQDPAGKRLFVEFVETVKAHGAGFVSYKWPKPGHSEPVDKLTYVKGFAPWGWVIGSGVYIDTIDAAIAERLMLFAVAAMVLAGLLGLLGWAVSHSLITQLGGEPADAASAASRIAAGDLGVDIRIAAHDTSSLMFALRSMRDGLSGLVKGVRHGAESVATASGEIAQGNLDLSQRTERQATALQETSASMVRLGHTVCHSADNARQANQLAQGASSVASRGGEEVAQVVQTMKGIHDSAKKIADITGVVDAIAFQTNILALNAAVEAARAGEQGRGFAVVASEVRSLAGRSATAAREIKQLIGESVAQADHGSAQVDQARDTMAAVVQSIRRVTDLMQEISSASAEQSQGVTQVGQNVSQMDTATQQNAALVEESAAAAESLRLQAERLVQAVAVFNLAPAGAE